MTPAQEQALAAANTKLAEQQAAIELANKQLALQQGGSGSVMQGMNEQRDILPVLKQAGINEKL